MKKFLLLPVFSLIFFGCEPEENPTPPDPPEIEVPEPTQPEVLSVQEVRPVKNDIGDTVTIEGKNFSRELRLSLDEIRVSPVLLNDTIIKFKIPFGDYDPFNFQLKLEDNGDTLVLQDPYQLYAPVIDSIPERFGFAEKITLYGKHLTNPASNWRGILYLNELEVDVLSHSRDSIVFELPWEAQKFQYDVRVKAQLQEVSSPGALKIQPPSFERLSKTSVDIGEVITLYGSYFYPNQPGLNKISFQGNRAEVLEAYRDSLKVRIPMGPYKSREIKELKIQLFEKESLFSVNMDILSTWYMYGYKRDYDISHGTGGVGNISPWSFAANGAFYFNVYRRNSRNIAINNVLYKYTPEDDQWEEIDLSSLSVEFDFGDRLEFYPQRGTPNVLIYLYRDTDNLYKLNLETREVVQLKDHPIDQFLQHGIGFHLNGNFYFGHGYTWDMGTHPNRMFWRYDYNSDTWTEIGAMPDATDGYSRLGTSIFYTANSVIIGNGHDIAYDQWEFSANETWTRKADILDPTSNAIHVQKNQKGFYYNYLGPHIWEYDIPGDQWTRRDDLQIGYYSTGHETMFIHDNYVYYVGYLQDYTPDGTPYFRHDHAILRTELSNLQ